MIYQQPKPTTAKNEEKDQEDRFPVSPKHVLNETKMQQFQHIKETSHNA
jgi:hypothetical protein